LAKVITKGHKKIGGRVKGTPNKITAELKDMILQALDEAGGVEYLVSCAKKNPQAFLTLVGKVLPLQVTGKDGQDLKLTWVINDNNIHSTEAPS
jgi:hypothetical protein